MVQLNSKLNQAKKELDELQESLEALNDPNIKKIQDQFLLPTITWCKRFQGNFSKKYSHLNFKQLFEFIF